MRTKSRIYNKFIEKYDLGEKEKYVFDLNKFNKIDSLPGKLFNILKEEFIDKNKEEFLNFSNIKKSNIDETIRPLKSEKNNIEGGIKRLNESREELKEGVCPQCHYRDKSRAKRICPDCAKKNEIYLRRMKKNNPVIHEVATTVGHTAYNLSHPKKYRHYD
jgi:rubrerythrin